MTGQHDAAELIRASYHESGHLVACACFSRPVVSVSIDPGASRGAHIGLWPTARNADVIRETLIILAAGPVAAMIFDPTADPGDGGGAGGDASQMIETGWTLCGRLVDAEVHHHELQLAERRAAKLIRDNWAHVEQVARSLLTHHQLVARGPHVEKIGDLD